MLVNANELVTRVRVCVCVRARVCACPQSRVVPALEAPVNPPGSDKETQVGQRHAHHTLVCLRYSPDNSSLYDRIVSVSYACQPA